MIFLRAQATVLNDQKNELNFFALIPSFSTNGLLDSDPAVIKLYATVQCTRTIADVFSDLYNRYLTST